MSNNGNALVAEVLMRIFEDACVRKYYHLKLGGQMTEQLKMDFLMYLQAARELYTHTGINFSPNLVHEMLPSNLWIPHVATQVAKKSLAEKARLLSNGTGEYHELLLTIAQNSPKKLSDYH